MNNHIIRVAAAFIVLCVFCYPVLQAAPTGGNKQTQDEELEYVLELASDLNDDEEYEKAITVINDALKKYQDNYRLYYQLSYAKTELNDFIGAEKDIKKCLDLNPEYAWGYFHAGLIKQDQGMKKEALKYFDKAVTLEWYRSGIGVEA
jgi:tetratricopeptide (TPR) repeat protein